MSKKIRDLTVRQVETALRELAEESPDYRYNTSGQAKECYYDQGIAGEPESKGCIFGQAFRRLGVIISDVQENVVDLWNGDLAMQAAEQAMTGGTPNLTEGITDAEIVGGNNRVPSTWGNVQHMQDNGSTWGEAVKELDYHIPRNLQDMANALDERPLNY
tara:strand:- start:2283 stop:2762 length:480 start_codon:yes stop_codon:yes gene_type:complete